MAETINFSGIASGIDTNALIDSILASQRATRVVPLEDKVSELNETTTVLKSVQTKLLALQAKLRNFSSLGTGAVAKTGVSSDETIATATITNGTPNGSFAVTVTQVATNAKMVIPSVTTYAASTTAMGVTPDGNVVFSVGGTTVNVAATATTTLAQFSDAFNTAAGGKATAVITNVGSTAVPAYKLLISTANTGAITGAVTLATPLGLTETHTTSTDATFSISGVGTTITRASNTVTDVIPGVTFNLKAAGTATITVQNDASATTTSVKEFITLYNDVIATINDNNTVQRDESNSKVKNIFGTLAKTSTDDAVMSGLRSALSSISYSLTDSGGTPLNNVVNFSSMGITTDANSYDAEAKTGGGTLKLREKDENNLPGFLSALASEPDSINKLLTRFADLVSLTSDGSDLINDYVKSGGAIDIVLKSNSNQVRDMNLRISTIESQLSNQERSLRSRYAAFEALTGRLQQQQSSLTSALKGLG